jgi:hypothetical protein
MHPFPSPCHAPLPFLLPCSSTVYGTLLLKSTLSLK